MTRESTKQMIEPSPPARKADLRPGEIAVLVFLAFMTVIAWTHPGQIPTAMRASLLTVTLLFLLAALALGEERQGWRYWARELLPVPVVPYVFLNIGRLIPLVNGRILDDVLFRCDRALLGPEAQAALYAVPLPPWLADVLTLAYSTFFFQPIVLAVTLAARRDSTLPRVTTAVLFSFVVSYAGYFVVPAYGPRATVAQGRYATLPPGAVGAPIRDLLDHWEKTKMDAFPSGHTMVTLAVLYCARKRVRWLYNVLLPIVVLLVCATVLLTYHYLVDVLAALPLLALSLAAASLLHGPVPFASRAAPVELPMPPA